MKRTIVISGIFTCIVILFSGLPENGNSAQLTTCDQYFHVQNENGDPMSGCNVYGTAAALNCTTDDSGNCYWTVESGNLYSALVSCGELSGGTEFTACTARPLIIVVH